MTEEEIKKQLAEMVSDEATDPVVPNQTPESEYKEVVEWQQRPN